LKYFLAFLRRRGLDQQAFLKKIHNGQILKLNPSEHIQQQIFWYGFYEKKFILAWENLIGEDAIVLDIGANLGYYSLVAANKAKKGMVYAFEPSPHNRKSLKENLELNQVKNITILPWAVSNESGETKFYQSGQDNSGMSALVKPENFSGQSLKVHAISLDEWLEITPLKKIDLIKMDIEGAEFRALLGMKQLLQKYQPILFIEIDAQLLRRFDTSPSAIHSRLNTYGYKAYTINDKGKFEIAEGSVEGDLVIFCPEGKLTNN
jgi:FkbM family methyltransferase